MRSPFRILTPVQSSCTTKWRGGSQTDTWAVKLDDRGFHFLLCFPPIKQKKQKTKQSTISWTESRSNTRTQLWNFTLRHLTDTYCKSFWTWFKRRLLNMERKTDVSKIWIVLLKFYRMVSDIEVSGEQFSVRNNLNFSKYNCYFSYMFGCQIRRRRRNHWNLRAGRRLVCV